MRLKILQQVLGGRIFILVELSFLSKTVKTGQVFFSLREMCLLLIISNTSDKLKKEEKIPLHNYGAL